MGIIQILYSSIVNDVLSLSLLFLVTLKKKKLKVRAVTFYDMAMWNFFLIPYTG